MYNVTKIDNKITTVINVCSKRDRSVMNNGMTCNAAVHQNSLTTC